MKHLFGATNIRVLMVLPLIALATAIATAAAFPRTKISGGNRSFKPPQIDSDFTDEGKAPAYRGKQIVLGEFGSLTGVTATFGTSTHNGIMMAVDEANKAGGVLGRQIRVKLEDDAGKPQQASAVVKKLVNRDNVLAVLGEVASSRSLAAAPVCQAAGVPMISPSSTNPKVTQVGDYIFRSCFIDPFQGTINARFAFRNLKAKKAAVLTDVKNDYSVGLTQFFSKEFRRLGGKITTNENYKEGDADFGLQLTKIRSGTPDVIFVPGYYTDVGAIARQARQIGLQQTLLGGDGWESPKLTEIAGKALRNSYFSTHFAPQASDLRTRKFVSDFRKRFGDAPDALAALGYDAARIMIGAIKRAGSTDRVRIRDAIAGTRNFPGVTGNITLDGNRNAVKPLVMVRVKGDRFVYETTVNP